jgi:RNA polymerase sigma factor (sigma-70 family)
MLRKLKTGKKQHTSYIHYSTDNQEVDVNLRENRVIRIGKELVPVTEEVYKAYYQMDRRARYLEEDLKVGSSKVDPTTGEVVYKSSKEDSLDRLLDKGINFEVEKSVEDIVCDKAMLHLLDKAKEILDEEELKLIDAVYEKELTYRQAGEIFKISHVAVQKRHNKIIDKLKKYFL